jgi:serine/threonine protein kinase
MTNCPVCANPLPDQASICPSCGAVLANTAAFTLPVLELPANTLLCKGAYRIARVLGRGGFGITYLAHETEGGKAVTIKELFLDGSGRHLKQVIPPMQNGATGFREARERFLNEAGLLSKFDHPGISKVLTVFEENKTAYMAIEYLEGQTLEALLLQNGTVPINQVMVIASSLCEVLALIHDANLLHRDIKPANIMLTDDQRVVLIDFGSARIFSPGQAIHHTQMVTPGYAAPEQYATEAVFGPYTDIYSLGATLYHAVMGVMPAPATDRLLGVRLALMHLHIPAKVRHAITSCLHLQIANRPHSIEKLQEMLGLKTKIDQLKQPTIAPVAKKIFKRGNLELHEHYLKFNKMKFPYQKIDYFVVSFNGKINPTSFNQSLIIFTIISIGFSFIFIKFQPFIFMFLFLLVSFIYFIYTYFILKGGFYRVKIRFGARLFCIFESEDKEEIRQVTEALENPSKRQHLP